MHVKAVLELSVIHVTTTWFKRDSLTKPFCVTWCFVVRLTFKPILFSANFFRQRDWLNNEVVVWKFAFSLAGKLLTCNLPDSIWVIRIIPQTLTFDWEFQGKRVTFYLYRYLCVNRLVLNIFFKFPWNVNYLIFTSILCDAWKVSILLCEIILQKIIILDNLLPSAKVRIVAL